MKKSKDMLKKQVSLFYEQGATSAEAATEVITETMAEPIKEPAKEPVKARAQIKSRPRITPMNKVFEKITKGLKDYFEQQGFKKAALGLSGGVDSALTLVLAVETLGAENVSALILPELGLTKQENTDHSKMLCDFFGVRYFYQPINPFLTDIEMLPWRPSGLAKMNTKARIRAVLLYNFANTENALVLGTSNKSELLLGYGTKYGDLAADVEVIGDLLKTEVIKLAEYAGLPPEIVNKTPTAELAPNQTDEEEMGASYQDMDKVLSKIDIGQEAAIEYGLPAALTQMVFGRVKQNKHKSLPPFIIKAHE